MSPVSQEMIENDNNIEAITRPRETITKPCETAEKPKNMASI